MYKTRSVCVMSLSMAVLAGALGSLGAVPSRAADELKCNKCVDTRDVANRTISRKKIKPAAVDGTRLRDGAVTPAKWALRLFDANNTVVGQTDHDGRVLLRATGSGHAGEWFTLSAQRAALRGGSVFYTADDCGGQAYMLAFNARAVPVAAGIGPDPALGAVAGEPVRLVFFLPNNPAAPPTTNTIESQTTVDSTGKVTCFDTLFALSGVLADVIDSPDTGGFTPPFRVGVK